MNPGTGRMIKVGGATYRKVMGTSPRRATSPRVARPRSVRASEYGYLPPHLERKAEHLEKMEGEGRGSPTRGWSLRSPRRGRGRHQVMDTCGPKCFLLPEEEKFPICARCSARGCSCAIDCQGLQAAYNRAQQYKYPDVAEKARKMLKQKCGK